MQAISQRMARPGPSNPGVMNPGKLKAMADLQHAISELKTHPTSATGSAKQPSSNSAVDFTNLMRTSASELSLDELDALGRLYFDGSDVVPKDVQKALELWQEGATRGSITSRYSLAMCTKEGISGVKNPEMAFSELIDIADNHKFSHAQVSKMRFF